MNMTGFICHDDYYDRLARLTDEEVGHLFRQLMLYHAGREDEMTDFIGIEGLAFDFIAADIDRMEEKCETNSQNGSKGGRPRKQRQPYETEENRTKPNETEKNRIKPTETEENRTKAYKDKDKEKEIDKENIKREQEKKQERFLRFWTVYPRHEAKAVAQKTFEKIDPDEELLQIMIAAVNRWKQTAQWQENGGQYIPHPATWLNQRRWEDEPPKQNVRSYSQRDNTGAQDEAMEEMRRMLREARGETA